MVLYGVRPVTAERENDPTISIIAFWIVSEIRRADYPRGDFVEIAHAGAFGTGTGDARPIGLIFVGGVADMYFGAVFFSIEQDAHEIARPDGKGFGIEPTQVEVAGA